MVDVGNGISEGYSFSVLVVAQNKWGRGPTLSAARKAGLIGKAEKQLIYAGWVKTCYADEVDGRATWEGTAHGGMVCIEKVGIK